MIKHLPSNCLGFLLEIVNMPWSKGLVPQAWRNATIIPIPKAGKDPSEVLSWSVWSGQDCNSYAKVVI